MNKQSFITIQLTVLMIIVGVKAFAHDIEVDNGYGKTIYYKWNKSKTQLSVCYCGINPGSSSSQGSYSGNIIIPKYVEYEGTQYSVTSIGDEAFSGCSKLVSVTIPNSVTSIGNYAFAFCDNLTSLIIPNNVTSIGNYAFSECSLLSSITIPNSVTTIGGLVFSYCVGLTSVTIPSNVTSIGEEPFKGCSNLNSVTIYSKTIGSWFRNVSSIEQVTIGEDVKTIGDDAFRDCCNLKSINIPSSVTSIGNAAFYGCSKLTSITIPNSVTTIDKYAFCDCSGLKTVILSKNLTSIKGFTFESCINLTSITIPNSVNSIGECAFRGAEKLAVVVSEIEKPFIIYDNVFAGIPTNAKLIVPYGKKDIYQETTGWKNFRNIVEAESKNKCETPTVSINGDVLTFACKTEGVLFHYNITHSDVQSGITNSNISLTNTYTVSVYASKDDFSNSEIMTLEFIMPVAGKKGDVDGNGVVNVADHVELSKIIMDTK